jgi:hypothetical protein
MHQDGGIGKAKGTPMTTHAVTLQLAVTPQLPEHLYLRLRLIAQATHQAFDDAERTELTQLWTAVDRFMLRNWKVQAAALLRWRGHHIPPADKL